MPSINLPTEVSAVMSLLLRTLVFISGVTEMIRNAHSTDYIHLTWIESYTTFWPVTSIKRFNFDIIFYILITVSVP